MVHFDISILAAFAIAVAVAAAIDLPGLRTGLSLADEGYLWYGTEHVLEGRVPIRDFRAYDPGRYYWCALFCLVLGRRILSLRLAMLVLRVATLALAAGLIHRASDDWLATALWTLALGACAPAWFKRLEPFFCVAAVAIAVLLLETPTAAGSYALAGGFAGLSWLFGLNLALYGSGAFVATTLFAMAHSGQTGPNPLLWLATGVLVGCLPAVLLGASVPGLGKAYWRRKLATVLRRRSTNITLPIPWLWRPTPPHVGGPPAHQRFVKAAFTALPVFYAAMFAGMLLAPLPDSHWVQVAVASACVGSCYMHHATSRADSEHLWLALTPFVIGIASVAPGGLVGILLAVGAAATAWFAVHSAVSEAALRRRHPEQFTRFPVGRDELWLQTPPVRMLEETREIVEAHSRVGDPVLFLPLLATLYPLWSRRAAVYDIFCVRPAEEGAEDAMLAAVERERVRVAVVWNMALDGLEERRFSRTHPRLWQHLEREFERRPLPGPFGDFHCFVRP